MPDVFLEAHRVGPLQFAISGPLSPISIRDQMVRAKMFVDRAIEAALISQERPLFVLGAGAGGAAAAIYAANLGIQVTIIDIKHHVFGPQRKCLTRLVNPTQYDWPVDHWPLAVFPWRGPAMPLPWRTARANQIAAIWTHTFNQALRQNPAFLTCQMSTQLVSRTFRTPQNDLEIKFEVDFADPVRRREETHHYGAALYAIGFGTEKSTLGTYKGFDFWDTDDFELPLLGLPTASRPYRVLICGGGDGALQDFLRITTGQPSAADLLNKILPYMPGDWLSIYSSEDQGQRAQIWNDSLQDHLVMMLLEYTHRTEINQLLSGAMGAILRNKVVDLLRRDLDITLIHTCTHFSQSYALNRFLARLIEECARRAGLAIQIRERTAVASITGNGHICTGDPRRCHGTEHEVQFRDAAACGLLGNLSGKGSYDVVVVRIGVQPPPQFAGLQAPLCSRHMLPYHPAY